MSSNAPDFVELAVFTQPHGVSGRLKVKSFTEPPEAFVNYEGLRDVAGNEIKLRVTGQAQGQFIVEIEGLKDRNQAELWRGKKLGVLRTNLKPITDDVKFYVNDLIDMKVVRENGESFGTVTSVNNFGAGDILEIKRTSGAIEMYSFTNVTFPKVDREVRRITIAPPEIIGTRAEEEAKS